MVFQCILYPKVAVIGLFVAAQNITEHFVGLKDDRIFCALRDQAVKLIVQFAKSGVVALGITHLPVVALQALHVSLVTLF